MSMKQFLVGLVMLAGGTYGLFEVPDTECDATQTTSLCSPALGGSVNIKLMNNASGYKLSCYKNVTSGLEVMFKLNKGTVAAEAPYQNRTDFYIGNGTLKITNMKKSDTGRYIVTVHNADGEHEKDIRFILKVKETSISIWILIGAVVGAVLIKAVCCFICWKRRCCRKSGISQTKVLNAELQPSADLTSDMLISSKPY